MLSASANSGRATSASRKLCSACVELIQRAKHAAQVVLRFGVARIVQIRPLQHGGRFVELPLRLQHRAEPKQRVDVLWIGFEQQPQGRFGLGRVLLFQVKRRQARSRLLVAGPRSQGGLVRRLGLGRTSGVAQQVAQVELRPRQTAG